MTSNTLSLVRGEQPQTRKSLKGMPFSKESISPKQAYEYISFAEQQGFINRNLSESRVNTLAHEMRQGRYFTDTGETIKFSITLDGVEVLIDGQHRLRAIIKANKTISLWVVRGVPIEAFRYLDQGKGREVKDILFIEDERWRDNTAALAVTGRMLWKRNLTGDPTRKPDSMISESEGNIADAIRANFGDLPELFQLHKLALNAAQKDRVGPKSLFLFLIYEWSRQDSDLCEDVVHYIQDRYVTAPPSVYFAYAVKYIDGVRTEAAKSTGRITKGRHKDVVDETLKAWMLAWNQTRTKGPKIKEKTFMTKLGQLKGVPLAQ